MVNLLNNLQTEQACLITAPPGWGKTYQLLSAIQASNRKVVFVFPLRALCEEVYRQAIQSKISCINLKASDDQDCLKHFQLIVTTPEQSLNFSFSERLFILDEFHLFYYWGRSFRESLLDFLEQKLASAPALMMLSATVSDQVQDWVKSFLKINYLEVIKLDFGNLKLINDPQSVYYYPKVFQHWLLDSINSHVKGECCLIFCAFRNQVSLMTKHLQARGFNVLSCVGGEAKEFSQKLNQVGDLEFIVATSVISHGVNLPKIKKIYFLYQVESLDFFLQMVGRGGRRGDGFEIHSLNHHYFSKWRLFKGFLGICYKRLGHKWNSFLYYWNES